MNSRRSTRWNIVHSRLITGAEDATAFAGCRAVAGDLTIERTELSNLSALSALRTVSGTLAIRDNPNLRDLHGLERLERAGSLAIHANGSCRTVGLENLRQVGTLSITSNPLLISLRGVRNLRRAETLVVSHNPRICAQLAGSRHWNGSSNALTRSRNPARRADQISREPTFSECGAGSRA